MNKITISNFLILISAIATFIAIINPSIYIFWLNTHFLDQWIYHIYFIQYFIWTFLHWDALHLFMNWVFLYFFWNIVEWIIWRNKFILFFLFTVIFNWALLTYFGSGNVIWISWFCMALISYYTLELKSRNDMEYKWWITAIIVNIWIWFIPWISLLGHLFWAIAWVLYYLYNKDFFRRKWVWEVEEV